MDRAARPARAPGARACPHGLCVVAAAATMTNLSGRGVGMWGGGGRGQVLHVGHLLRAGPGETGAGVARRMGMPMEQLLGLNFDLALEAAGGGGALPLQEGRTVCVVPSPCAAPAEAESVYAGLVFRDGRFVPA